ncbi:GFA family protein [Nannocystis sp. SCPEA4]|uniref:GFA family protein n=1 Tax=Nannocystis sp. SCPEA4 TaxID=2996787 RepID=UPI00226DADD2|nr:GFA family protein [Nannocystis sp. SCPEA4]MCY1061107.1 GFA family protein [Nannocystis sp. SCPEA4]
MTQASKHSGGCHCGKVRYDVNVDLGQPVLSCNCSICGKTGTLLAFVPKTEFRLTSGEGDLTDYQFASKTIHHLFCSTCGVRSFGRGVGPDGTEMVALNVRCLDDVDVAKLAVNHYDGKNA